MIGLANSECSSRIAPSQPSPNLVPMKNTSSGPSSSASLISCGRSSLQLISASLCIVSHLAFPAIAARSPRAANGFEIVDTLAHADEMHGQGKFLRDGDEDAAARRAVELGHHQPGHPGTLAEDFDLIEGILSGRGIERQQCGVRRASGRPS